MKGQINRLRCGKTVWSVLLVVVMLLGMFPWTAQAASDVTLTFKSGAAQDYLSRYLLYFEDLDDKADKYWNQNTVYIDGKEVSGEGVHYVHLDDGFALLLSYNLIEANVTAAADMARPHTLQIKSGTALAGGEYTISNDVWLKLNGYDVTTLNSVDLTYVSGVAQDYFSRFALTFEGFPDSADKYWNNNTVYIDGNAVTGEGVHYLPDSGNNITLYLSYSLIEADATAADSMGTHTLEIPAGALLGTDYAVQKSVRLQIKGSSVSAAPEANIFALDTSDPGGWQPHMNRYLIWLRDDIVGEKKNLDNVQLLIDGQMQTVETYLSPEGRYALLLNATCGITELGEHSIQITAGQSLGAYTVLQDVILYTHADGSVSQKANTPVTPEPTVPAEKPVTLGLDISDPGGWQPHMSRYLIWLTDDISGEKTAVYSAAIVLDGESKTAEVALVDGRYALLLNAACGISSMGEHTVVICKDSDFGGYKITQAVTIYTYADGSVTDQPPVKIPEPSETVTVLDDIRNHQNACADCIWFAVSPADKLPYDLQVDSCKYTAAEGGGIYLNGKLIDGVIIKKLENLYYLNLTAMAPLQKGDVLTIDGVFGNGDYAVRFERQSFAYAGDGNWEPGDYLRDLREQKYTIQDISELKMGVSEFQLRPGEQVSIGEAISGTNIAIEMKVELPKSMTELKFGFSKINGMWDAEESGWQISLLPAYNQIKMLHDMSSLQTMGEYQFTDDEYVIQIGSVNLDEYIDGVNQGVYCRKIFVKINGKEVMSYKDMNLNRNIGKKLYVYASNEVDECKLVSLTSQGVILRELTPTVYDYHDISGFAESAAQGDSLTCLGSIEAKSNYAIRLYMDPESNASQIKMAIGKVNPESFWEVEESGWQLWMRPSNGQLFLAHSMDTWEVLTGYEYANSYVLEFGVKDQVVEKNGKYVSTVCRILYVMIDGKEVARWEDTNFQRPLGEYALLYCDPSSGAEISTMKNTTTLPVQMVVNGEAMEESEFVQMDTTVVEGEPSKIQMQIAYDPNNKIILNGVYYNDQKIESDNEENGKYTYTLENPQNGDRFRVELTTKELRADEPEKVFDLFDLSGEAVVFVPKYQSTSLGMMVDQDGQASANSAIRYGLDIPETFNRIPLTILGDSPGLWGNHGAMLEITPGQVHFCHTATSVRLASFKNELFDPGNTVCVEFGVVKCYEEGVYKYDRWYVKAGETEETMTLVAWYDSLERSCYGGHVVCYGVDFGDDYKMYSLKETYSITDISTQENKDLLRTYTQIQKQLPELYFVGRAVAYTDASTAEYPVQIKFYTKPGTTLKKLTVDGEDVTAAVTNLAMGAYCYTIPSLCADVAFSYEITEDTTIHSITVTADEVLAVTLSDEKIITGGDITVSVNAKPGYVPVLSLNGADVTDNLILDKHKGVWTIQLKSVRSDIQLQAKAQERNYIVEVAESENGTITLGGDVVNGKLPYGGRLELTLTPNAGCYLQSVTVNGVAIDVDSEGKADLEAIYYDADTLNIEAVFIQLDALNNGQNVIVWIGIGTAVVAALVAALLVCRKRKERKDKS